MWRNLTGVKVETIFNNFTATWGTQLLTASSCGSKTFDQADVALKQKKNILRVFV
jgi:hypothetical protein